MIPLAPKNELPQKYDRIIYCDMDGVIVDFHGGFEKLPGAEGLSVDDYESKYGENSIWKVINPYGKVKFFSELPWHGKGGQQLWGFITNNFLNVKILTALGKSDAQDKETSRGKLSWLKRNIPTLAEKDIIMVPNKHAKKHWARPGDILIDDTDICINEWVKKGGIGFLHTSGPDTIRKLEKYV